MSLPACIGLYSSSMGQGKTEVSKILVQEYGYTVVKFAGPLKKMAEVFLNELGITTDELTRYIEGDMKEKELPGLPGVSPRRIMQTLGYEWGQEYLSPEVWVIMAVKRISAIIKAGGRAVVDDLRYPQEFEALAARGSYLIKLERKSHEKTVAHRSEGLLNNHAFTHILTNNLDVSALRSSVNTMLAPFDPND